MLCSRPCLRLCCQQNWSKCASKNGTEDVLWFLGAVNNAVNKRGSLVVCRKRQVWDDGLCGDMGLCKRQHNVPVMFSAFASYSKGCTSHTAGNRGVQEVSLCSYWGPLTSSSC